MELQSLIASTHFKHSQQVARISELLALKMGFSPEDIALIAQAAAFHDIGKVFIPKEILDAPRRLTAEEYAIVKTHTDLGYKEICNAIQVLSVAAAMCRDHHEWVDGIGGYVGCKSIHPFVRLVSVADVFDALFSRRCYKKAWDIDQISAYFREQSERQFECAYVDCLLDNLGEVLALYEEATP